MMEGRRDQGKLYGGREKEEWIKVNCTVGGRRKNDKWHTRRIRLTL